MDPAVVLPLAAFLALSVLFVAVLRRASQVFSETRDAMNFRRGVAEISRRAGFAIDSIGRPIDGLRRRELGPDAILGDLEAAQATIDRCRGEARALRAPTAMLALRDVLADELERAGRALDSVEYGRSILAAGVRDWRGPEAGTSIKRGYLNLLHAREAIERHAAAVAGWRTADEAGGLFRRRRA